MQKETLINDQEQDEGSNRNNTKSANSESNTSPQTYVTGCSDRHDDNSNLCFKVEKTAGSKSQQQTTITEKCREDREERRSNMSKEDMKRSSVINGDHIEERKLGITSPYPLGVSPHREPTTPFSMFLGKSSPSPNLILPDGE